MRNRINRRRFLTLGPAVALSSAAFPSVFPSAAFAKDSPIHGRIMKLLRMAVPLIISTDQEGGSLVFRLTAPATA